MAQSQLGQIVHETLSQKYLIQKGLVVQGVDPEFKPQHCKHKTGLWFWESTLFSPPPTQKKKKKKKRIVTIFPCLLPE
jgi:hypothetical protein